MRSVIMLLVLSSLLSLLVFTLSAHAETILPSDADDVIEKITIEVDKPLPGEFDWQGFALALIDLQPDDGLTSEALDRAIQRLRPFAQVQHRIDRRPQGVEVTFILQPFSRIKSIGMSGLFPLFEEDVLAVMTVASGDIFRPEDMPEQKKRIAQRFQAEGYIDPQVEITWEPDSEDGQYRLRIRIDKGPAFSIGQVRITGNRAMEDGFIKSRLSVWRRAAMLGRRARFRIQRLEKDLRKLTSFYRRQGFADAVVTPSIAYDRENRQVAIDLTIDEGPLYETHFSGMQFFGEPTLRKDLVLFQVGNRGNVGLRRSIQNIRRRYLKAGFADVRIQWRDEPLTDENQEKRDVFIEVHEGERHIVNRVSVEGNQGLQTADILKQLLTRPPSGLASGAFVADVLQEDLNAVRALYLKHGFLDVQVSETVSIHEESKKTDVTIHIVEGVQTRVAKILFEGDTPIPSEALVEELQLQPGGLFRPYMVQNDENAMTAQIAPLGYPYVQVRGQVQISDDRSRADIVYTIDTGPLVKVGGIFFAGNFRTRVRILKRELDLETGEPFDLATVFKAQRDLRNLDIFKSVQVRTIGLKEKAATVDLLVTVVEKKPYFVELGGGYQTDKGFYGRTKLGDHNLSGTNMDIWLGGEVSEVGYRWDFGIGVPRIFDSRINADVGLFGERSEPFNQDFGTQTDGGQLGFSRKWGDRILTGLGWRYERREQFLREQSAAADTDPETLQPRTILVTTPLLQYDNRDDFLRPRTGWLGSFSVDISKGLDSDLDDFLKYRFDVRVFRLLFPRLTMAARGAVGYLEPYGGTVETPKDQLFFLGGTSTVRGFGENLLRFDANGNPVGGQIALLGSFEVRFDVGRNFELSTFVDTGSIQQALEEGGDDDFQWSAGVGLHYITPIGPMGVYYGHKLDRRPGESSGQFHFSIGYTF